MRPGELIAEHSGSPLRRSRTVEQGRRGGRNRCVSRSAAHRLGGYQLAGQQPARDRSERDVLRAIRPGMDSGVSQARNRQGDAYYNSRLFTGCSLRSVSAHGPRRAGQRMAGGCPCRSCTGACSPVPDQVGGRAPAAHFANSQRLPYFSLGGLEVTVQITEPEKACCTRGFGAAFPRATGVAASIGSPGRRCGACAQHVREGGTSG